MKGSASQAGFYYQNNVAALKIIECLFFDTDITHILLDNYEEGDHIDDIIIYRKNKIDYYQVKWSNDTEKVYSLNSLISAEEGKKSLFKQLSEGFTKVRNTKEDFTITLFTTKRESKGKRPSKGLNHSLSEIRRKVFEPAKKSTSSYINLENYKTYKSTLEKIRRECSLDHNSFNEFIKKLEFKFSQETNEQIQNAIKFRLKRLGIEDSLFEKLLDGVVKWSISGEKITKHTVLKQLDITERFEDKLSHYFKIVDDSFYVPNRNLQQNLEKSISELSGGYIFIEGLPGIGKSTALSKFKESTSDTTIAYYCFIPDAKNDFGEFRHQSNYFLKSLCISIEKQFPEVDLPNKYSERFEEKLALYIDKLGSLKKTILFIIDGLDHVHRDTSLSGNSLLDKIKGKLPDGVFFILSSQYKAVLSSSVLLDIKSDERRHIIVEKFNREEIEEYLRNKQITSTDIIDKIEKVSRGIPLYLHYISELLNKTEKNDYENTLKQLPDLKDGEISSYHEYLFQKIEDDELAKWVLSIIAKRKENSSIGTICEILKLAGETRTKTEIISVVNRFSHLLRHTDGRSYSIFHNSFREFILEKTSHLTERFNIALVLFYEKTPDSDEAYRNYFKHLYEVGNYEKVVSLTTIEWMKTAWRNYRVLEEISENIDIALKCCIKLLSLSSYTRIAFLKAQFSQLSWNLEQSNIDFPSLLLHAGKTANSIRSIWDGDFLTINKKYFCYFLNEYYLKTGNLLPENIIKAGFQKSSKGNALNDVIVEFKAKALIYEDINELFQEIDSIQWVKSDDQRADYHKRNFNKKENAKENLKVKLKVVDHLLEVKQFKKLITLSKEVKLKNKLRLQIQIALVKLLLPTDPSSAISILRETELANVPDKLYFKLISYCTEFLSDTQIIEYFPERNFEELKLYDKIVENENMSYSIRYEIIELYETLKPIHIYQPNKVNQLSLRASALSIPASNIYSSVFQLSDLWYKNRTSKVSLNQKLIFLKQCLKELYIPNKKKLKRTSEGLFDYDSDSYFIASSIKYLINSIFQSATNLLSCQKIIELGEYYFELEKTDDGYRHHSIALGIANELQSSKKKDLSSTIYKLIQHSEKIARYEEKTATLTEYIGEVAEVYGICGFKKDFERIYNQLIEISFGVAYKKDYQASYILSPLKLLHEVDPDNTLRRLAEVLEVQHKLANAGNSRMLHICLSDIISFSANRFPELAFLLLQKEENNLWRAEAIERVLSPLIKSSSSKDLPLYFSIVKTLPRWTKDSTRDDFFIPLSLIALERAIELDDKKFILRLLKTVKLNLLVELEDKSKLEEFSEVFIKADKDYNRYELPTPVKKETAKKEKAFSQGEKFSIKYSTPSLSKLLKLFNQDYNKFEEFIKRNYQICIQNRRNETLRNEFFRSKSTFEKFYEKLPSEAKSVTEKNIRLIIKNFIQLKNKIINLNPNQPLTFQELDTLFSSFVEEINRPYANNELKKFIENEFEKDKWIDNILSFINDHRDHVFSKVIAQKNIIGIVEEASILKYEEILKFIEDWTTDRAKSLALVRLAKRLINVEESKAKEIIHQVSFDQTNSLFTSYFYGRDKDQVGFEVIDTFLNIDQEFGKKILLESYTSQKSGYTYDLIGSFDQLMRYEKYFDEPDLRETLYKVNLTYNEELAKGLPEVKKDFSYIKTHEEKLLLPELIIKYLVQIFNYPVVKIRELALKSIFDLTKENSSFLKLFLKYGITNGNSNQVEHSLTILNSISLLYPQNLIPFKKELLSCTSSNHFNIAESLKELLFRLNEFDERFLEESEIKQLNQLNKSSSLIFNNSIIDNQRGKHFLYSEYQVNLLRKLYENDYGKNEIHDDLYADLVKKGLGSYDPEVDSAVHRRYNSNTNFDTIEIHPPYYDEVKDSLNKVFQSKIKRDCFEDSFVNDIQPQFRLYDPSKSIIESVSKPGYIQWLPDNISEEDFNSFKDFDNLIKDFTNRESDYITLAEFGSQRSKERFQETEGKCYFEVYAYLKKKKFDESTLDERLVPIIKHQNYYTYELPSSKFESSSFPVKEIKPLLEISYNRFRGENDLVSANLLPDIFEELGIEKKSLFQLITESNNEHLSAFRWQSAYTSGSQRRRYKPTSEGFTLKVNKDLLMNYLSRKQLVLCYDVKLRRSTTQYKPELYMDWFKLKRKVEVDLLNIK